MKKSKISVIQSAPTGKHRHCTRRILCGNGIQGKKSAYITPRIPKTARGTINEA